MESMHIIITNTMQEALAKLPQGYKTKAPIYRIIGSDETGPILDTTTIVGYYLTPAGIIHREHNQIATILR